MANHNNTNNGTTKGFSLVELLVVIAIIAILAGIGLPVGMHMKKQAMRKTSQATVNLIAGACELYKADFEEFPPSARPASPEPGWNEYPVKIAGVNTRGSQLLRLLLTGYGPDIDVKGQPDQAGKGEDWLLEDDGKAGFGFRIVQRGKVYGPYVGMEGVESNDDKEFVDSFDNPILYYRYGFNQDDDQYQYTPSDNEDKDGNPMGPENLKRGAQSTEYVSSNWKSFVLCTTGPDEQWYVEDTDRKNDDIVNFSSE